MKHGRPKRKQKANQQVRPRIKPLLDFLNLDSFDKQSIERLNDGEHFELYVELFRESPENLSSLHSFILMETLPLIDDNKRDKHLQEICRKFRAMPFKAHVILLPERETGSMAGLDFDVDNGKSVDPKFFFYGKLVESAITGEIRELRRCRYCHKFFLADEPRKVFCRPKHGRLYHDDPARVKTRVDNSRSRAKTRLNRGRGV